MTNQELPRIEKSLLIGGLIINIVKGILTNSWRLGRGLSHLKKLRVVLLMGWER